MRLRASRVLAATTLAAALVAGGTVSANAATSSEVNVLTAASATWSTSGALSVTYAWEDHRTAADAAPGAVIIYVNTGQAWFRTTALDSSGTDTYTGTFSTSATPATLRLSVEAYTCSTDGSCSAPSLPDAEWVVTIAPGQTLSYTRPTPAEPAPTKLTASGVQRVHGKLIGYAALTDPSTGNAIAAPLQVQRRVAEGWKTVSTVSAGAFSVRAPKGTYRLHYSGTSAYASSSSRTFAR